MSETNNNTPSRPGEAALLNMKLLKSECSVFKVPKVPTRKVNKKSKVLDEELYVEVNDYLLKYYLFIALPLLCCW